MLFSKSSGKYPFRTRNVFFPWKNFLRAELILAQKQGKPKRKRLPVEGRKFLLQHSSTSGV